MNTHTRTNTKARKPRTASEIAERNYNLTRLLDIGIFEKRLPTKAEVFDFAINASRRDDLLKYVSPAEQEVLFAAVSKMQVVAIRSPSYG